MDEQSGFLSAASFLIPEGIVFSTAVPHVPFTFWLAAALKPRRFAVAETDDGAPPLPLAEAIRRNGAAMRAAEVHASAALGEASVRVDLVHLAIGSDVGQAASLLETWRSLLAEDGVLLIHGAAGPNGGPSRAFETVSAGRPSFLFPHGVGLGVVAAGTRPPTALATLLGADLAMTEAIRATYAALGSVLSERLDGAGGTAARSRAGKPDRRSTALIAQTKRRLAETERAIAATTRSRLERLAETERAAAEARNDVVQLAEAASVSHADEYRAWDAVSGSLAHTEALIDEHRRSLASARGARDLLRLGPLRRWRSRIFSAQFDGIAAAAAALSASQRRYVDAKTRKAEADRKALAAEPLASALEGAASALREEKAAAETMTSSLTELPLFGHADWDSGYAHWVAQHDTLSDADRDAIRARCASMMFKPLISVLVPVYNPPVAVLRQTIASVQAQLYPRWELCIADDASTDPAVCEELQAAAIADSRIRIVRRTSNGHISAASNAALGLAEGEFVALLDHDDLLPEHALFEIAAALNGNPDLDLIYSDEDHIDARGHRFDPYFKPDYNYDLMLGHNVVNHLGVYRRSLVEALGGFRLGYEGSQDYDLALRVIDASSPRRVHHIPAVLYHWRSDVDQANFSEAFLERCSTSARQALRDHLARCGASGAVGPHPSLAAWHRILRPVPHPSPLVSVIVPTKDGAKLLRPCCEGILNRTDYANIELVIVDHESRDPETLDLMTALGRDPRVRILRYEGPFNYAAINNFAVARARGDVLALLNNDVDVIHPEWLGEMVAWATLPDVGAVGAKLLYPDGLVQHAGVLLGPGGVAGHMFHELDRDEPGYMGRALMTAAVSAVTGACLVVRKTVFDEVGGFDAESLPVAFNDVDLCLRIGSRGYRNVWCAHAELFHHESASRGSDEVPERIDAFERESTVMRDRWGDLLQRDPAYNPNFELTSGEFGPANPPRRPKPWRQGSPSEG